MTYKELEAFRQEKKKQIKDIEKEIKCAEDAYCKETMEKAGYHIGDVVTNKKGEKGVIVGVELYICRYPRTIVAKMKKDGTASQVTSFSLGFEIPIIEE